MCLCFYGDLNGVVRRYKRIMLVHFKRYRMVYERFVRYSVGLLQKELKSIDRAAIGYRLCSEKVEETLKIALLDRHAH